MKRAIISAMLLMCVASAQATVTNLGTIHAGDVISLTENNLVGDFQNSYTFSTGPNIPALLVQWVTNRVYPFQADNQYSPFDNGHFYLNILSHTGELSFSGHGGGLNFTGGAGQFLPGTYNILVTTVPEADTWLILLIGIGFLAWHMRHKQV